MALVLADVPPESRRGAREMTPGEKTMKFRGLSAKSVTLYNSAQWTAGCFRDLSGVFLQSRHRARGRWPAGPLSAQLGRRGPNAFFFFLDVFNRVFLFKIVMNSAVYLYFCEN